MGLLVMETTKSSDSWTPPSMDIRVSVHPQNVMVEVHNATSILLNRISLTFCNPQ